MYYIEGLYSTSKFMTNEFYVLMIFKWTWNLHRWQKHPTRTTRIRGKRQHTKVTHPVRFLTDSITEPQRNSASGPQMPRKCVFCAHMLASLSQVMRRLHAGVRRSRNRHQLSQVYLICIVGVSQVYLKCTATRSQPSRTWISVHTIECTHDSKIWFRLAHYQRLFDGVSSEYKTLLYEISLLR